MYLQFHTCTPCIDDDGRRTKGIALTMMKINKDKDANYHPGGGDDRFTKFVSVGDGWQGW